MMHKAQREQIETEGKIVREISPDDLFMKFIKEYLCWYEKDFGKELRLVAVTNEGIFETA